MSADGCGGEGPVNDSLLALDQLRKLLGEVRVLELVRRHIVHRQDE